MSKPTTTATGRAGTDDWFHLLAANRRRQTLSFLGLLPLGQPVAVRLLAIMITAIERDCLPRNVQTHEYESAYNSLIQTHLPKLARAGVIEYEKDRKTVAATPVAIELNALRVYGECLRHYHDTQL